MPQRRYARPAQHKRSIRMIAAQHIVFFIINGRTVVGENRHEIFVGAIMRLKILKKLPQHPVSIADTLLIPPQLQRRTGHMRAIRRFLLTLYELCQWRLHLYRQGQLQRARVPGMAVKRIERNILVALTKGLHLLDGPLHRLIDRQISPIDQQAVKAPCQIHINIRAIASYTRTVVPLRL